MQKVLLINWDNYPNTASGGVYAWAKLLVENLDEFEFTILNCLSNANTNSRYDLPANVSRVIQVPLYGSLRPEEFHGACAKDKSLASILSGCRNTNDKSIASGFVPTFERFLEQLTSGYPDTKSLADSLSELNSFFGTHDLKMCLESTLTFEAFLRVLSKGISNANIMIKEALDLFSFLQRVLLVVSIQLPKVDLIHASNAWFPALAGVAARNVHNIPLIVTEHGVAFKDLLLHHHLSAHSQAYDSLWKVILTNLIRTVYDNSDLLSPVCEANAGVTRLLQSTTETRVCYNGVDTKKYRPLEAKNDGGNDKRPSVVFVGRIELLKDVLNLIQAISIVKKQLNNIVCMVYGVSSDLSYAKECQSLVEELGLQENVIFMGLTSAPERAYNSGDVVVLSSVREGFPYTVIEAMSCGKVVVATDVGGVAEALSGCGFLVRSRRPQELSRAILRVLTDYNLRIELEYRAIRTVEQKFTIEKTVSDWRKIYNDILGQNSSSGQMMALDPIGRST